MAAKWGPCVLSCMPSRNNCIMLASVMVQASYPATRPGTGAGALPGNGGACSCGDGAQRGGHPECGGELPKYLAVRRLFSDCGSLGGSTASSVLSSDDGGSSCSGDEAVDDLENTYFSCAGTSA
jgi:hypothetical protein